MGSGRGLMDFSLPELLVIGVLAVLVWGKNLPGTARKLSKHYARFRGYLSDMREEFERHAALEPEEPAEASLEAPPVEASPPERRRKSRPRKRRRGTRAS